ncbi:3-dehydro-L-gulonate 2-dehydrogenase [Acidaminobacter hydrogenoformans]|uniref:3-dehydro-L-gulonate 2-dehydrogenase n=1 Tax=Acidaminobacter hydrogenoformans DSM 2784 TaxID=1120920 RepID=A0A1G5RR30_9FIRM|nr:3-dehydro-L-gulonate 2-dehydrogenase [Acidaminobacter hydrogenoformans]SCZ76533.1 3-dehydro-L-gulonate 2-dehydrogenase [Acidaminobacter hydrogenoformans DSM 2784]
MRIPYKTMLETFTKILENRSLAPQDAALTAEIMAGNSLDGVYTHGVNRFPRLIQYIDKGYIDIHAKAECIHSAGAFERWNGRLGIGVLNARAAMGRAVEMAKTHGVGVVAMANTNHWMRGGTYGWQAADAGCVGICWTNTQPNMPVWGGMDKKIGNNPFVLAIPRSDGRHVVVDFAMSQFSYGKIEEARLHGKKLPVAGGYDSSGNLTDDPVEIEKTARLLPTGYWKGSSMSIALDLIAALLSAGFTTGEIGRNCEEEYGLSQVFIAIDQGRFNTPEYSDDVIEAVIQDLKSSMPMVPETHPRYPGERDFKVRMEQLENGIEVVPEVWEKILKL